jgi:membrane associated rhomboid family serine protease
MLTAVPDLPSLPTLPVPELETAIRAGVLVAVLAAAVVAWRLDRPRGQWGRAVRTRFVLGVPWGTLVSILGVLAVYLFVQDGWNHWYRPVTLPFSAWSYLYPLGWLTAPFAHAGPGHLTGNLLGTVALAPLVEYFFGHFPTQRGSSSFSSWRTNPWVRAFLLFPLGVFVVGLLSSVLAWGPVIGFSGVVFAFAGFALVRYPIAAVVALSAQSVLRTAYSALQNPIVVAKASPSFSEPWWAGIAVQGHALGLFLGVLAGVLLLSRREEHPSALRLVVGGVLLATSMSLWAIWWFRGGDSYVLYRGLGVVVVVAVAVVVTIAARASDRTLFGSVTRRQAGLQLVVLPLLVMAFVAVPLNFTAVGDAGVPGADPGVEVGDYRVTYGEDVPFQQTSVIDASFLGETTQINTSGVIVVSEKRNIWTREVSKGRLAFRGRDRVVVGGLGWRETVHVERQGWNAVGSSTAYQVWLRPGDEDWRHVFASEAASAEPVVAGRNVSIVPDGGEFHVAVSRNGTTLDRRPIPEAGDRRTVGNLTFVREENRLVAVHDETRVTVATRETYR